MLQAISYNISPKTKDDIHEITLAVAGFKKADIQIELEDGTLKIGLNNEMFQTAKILSTYTKALQKETLLEILNLQNMLK